MYKKLLLIIALIMTFLFTSVHSYAIASSPNLEKPKVVFEAKEITDFNELLDRAKQGETDKELPQETTKIIVNNKEQEVPVLKTTQLLKITQDTNGPKKDYAINAFIIVPLYIEDQYKDEDDGTGVVAYSTIYYSVVTSQGIDYYDMSSTSGGWIVDSWIRLSNRQVTLSNQGGKLGGGICNYTQNNYPSGNTYSYSYPSTWPPVATYGQYFAGMASNVDVTVADKTFHLDLSNYPPATL